MRFLLKFYLLLAAFFSVLLLFEASQATLFLANIRLYILAPVLAILLQCFRRRNWLPWLPATLVALFGFPWYLFHTPDYCAEGMTPSPRQSTTALERGAQDDRDSTTVINVMTLNLAGSSMPGKRNLSALISNNNIDVLSLQEVSPGFWKTEGAELKKRLPYVAYRRDDEGYWTQALLSKEPLSEIRFVDPGPGFSPKGARLIVQARWQGAVEMEFNSVHLSVPFRRGDCRGIPCLLLRYDQSDRDAQLQKLQTLSLARAPAPSVILGDLNLSDQNPVYRSFSGRAMDAGACESWNGTWPADDTFLFPFLRIDYVLIFPDHPGRRASRVRSYRVTIPGTDHLALISEIRFPTNR
ncbi:MAG: endonuclease/exonuclease/phosphatase family protein [Leptospiraceae bacterium]|nr:endonuclease/exonuclease/phosphatase family protein [Leptospiraceae bacterium]